MGCTHFKSYFKSADGSHMIAYYVFFPIGKIKGIVQISHGMCEYFERYSDFAEYLTDLGFAVCGNDHLGHGDSVERESELGYFSPENGWENVVEDMFTLTKIMKKSFGKLPYFLIGHSMGSFLSRAYVTKHGRSLSGAVFLGTSGGMSGMPFLLSIVEISKLLHGEKYRSKIINKIAFGAYNHKISDHVNEYDWISRDKNIVDKYYNDSKCSFIFTLNGFENLMKVLWYVTNDKWFETYPKMLPTFLAAGSGDPVGNYGKGVKRVYNRLKHENCNVDMKIYKEARHELVNEINRHEVYEDISDFLFEIMETDFNDQR